MLEVIIKIDVEKELLVVIADKDRQPLKLLFVSNTISGNNVVFLSETMSSRLQYLMRVQLIEQPSLYKA